MYKQVSAQNYEDLSINTQTEASALLSRGLPGVQVGAVGWDAGAEVSAMLAMAANKPSHTATDIRGTYRNKFQQGWLGGVGGDSQFQGVTQQVGRMGRKSNNVDLPQRMMSTTQPSWVRSYAFAPGLGVDALRSHITWTSKSGGLDPNTGLVAPILSSGNDRTSQEPMPATRTYDGGQGAVTSAPVNLHGGEAAADTAAFFAAQSKRGISMAQRSRLLKTQKNRGEL